MKAMLAIALIALSTTAALAQYGTRSPYGTGSNPQSHTVPGYFNNRGTYVQPYQRTNPNNNRLDNYNAPGNYNPNNNTFQPYRRRY